MYLNIKSLLLGILLVFGSTAFAQEDVKEETNQTKPQRGIIDVAAFNPMPVGDNFAADAYSPKIGGQVSLAFNLFSSGFLVGSQFSFYNTEISNVAAAGNYQRTNVYFFDVMAGYQTNLSEELKFLMSVGFGPSQYSSKSTDVSFTDTGFGLWIKPDISYKFNKNLGVFVSSTLRRDFMNIEAAGPMEDYFDHVNYINFAMGLRIYF